MLPFVMMPRPLQESNVVGKGGTAASWAGRTIRTTCYPPGDDMDMTKMDRISVDDLQLRPEVSATRLERRGRLRDQISAGMPDLEQAVARYDLPQLLQPGAEPGRCPAGPATPSTCRRNRRRCANATAGTRSASAACWPAA